MTRRRAALLVHLPLLAAEVPQFDAIYRRNEGVRLSQREDALDARRVLARVARGRVLVHIQMGAGCILSPSRCFDATPAQREDDLGERRVDDFGAIELGRKGGRFRGSAVHAKGSAASRPGAGAHAPRDLQLQALGQAPRVHCGLLERGASVVPLGVLLPPLQQTMSQANCADTGHLASRAPPSGSRPRRARTGAEQSASPDTSRSRVRRSCSTAILLSSTTEDRRRRRRSDGDEKRRSRTTTDGCDSTTRTTVEDDDGGPTMTTSRATADGDEGHACCGRRRRLRVNYDDDDGPRRLTATAALVTTFSSCAAPAPRRSRRASPAPSPDLSQGRARAPPEAGVHSPQLTGVPTRWDGHRQVSL